MRHERLFFDVFASVIVMKEFEIYDDELIFKGGRGVIRAEDYINKISIRAFYYLLVINY